MLVTNWFQAMQFKHELKRPPPCLLLRLVAIGRQGESVLLAGSKDALCLAVMGGVQKESI